MSKSIEIEFKNLLEESEYLKLVQYFQLQEKDFFTQENIYFDSLEGILKENRMGLRIRILDNSAELTLKTPLLEEHGLLETTDSLTLTEAEQILLKNHLPETGAVAKTLKELSISSNSLKKIGSLKTKRGEVELNLDTLIVLDESWYGRKHDFELEVEVSDPIAGKLFFHELLAQHKIPLRPAPNKIFRMVTALNEE